MKKENKTRAIFQIVGQIVRKRHNSMAALSVGKFPSMNNILRAIIRARQVQEEIGYGILTILSFNIIVRTSNLSSQRSRNIFIKVK